LNEALRKKLKWNKSSFPKNNFKSKTYLISVFDIDTGKSLKVSSK
jgi:hypothetical protein